MKVFLTGGTGFVGNFVAAKLLEAGHEVRALVRKGSESKLRVASDCVIVHGDLKKVESFGVKVEGCDAVINLVGIIREYPSKGVTFENIHVEGTINSAKAAMEAGVKRFIQMSALGARANAPTKYWRTKWEAEEHLRSRELDLTIFRPSTIIGPGGEFADLLKRMISAPVTPVIGDGQYKMQPVAVWNVAEFFVRSLETPATIGKAYEVGGPEAMTYDHMLRVAGEVGGKKVRLIHFPKGPMSVATKMFEGFSLWPVTTGQLAMLDRDSVCDNGPIMNDIPMELSTFREAISAAFGS